METRRRELLVAAGLLLAVPRALATDGFRYRVSFLTDGYAIDTDGVATTFGTTLRGRSHYFAGDSFFLDAKYSGYSAERTASHAAEVAAQKPSVVVATGAAVAPVCALKPPLPVVFVYRGDPVEAGFADSLARPGRNATGISLLGLDLVLKQIEFLRMIKPGLRRVAYLASPEHAGRKYELAVARAAAAQFGVEVLLHEVSTPGDLSAALPRIAAQKPDGALLVSDAVINGKRDKLAQFFLDEGIPSAADSSWFARSGHLLSYGPVRAAVWERAAYLADRVLRGEQPGDLPIEMPTTFELVVNRRMARALGLVVPDSILARVDWAIN